ncbi:MAG: ABC transporter ATP-binding protein [Gemmatimonadetes bacterium]|nr:ABC transporter ATP-binding protein [Gemmatimonadota bacterium]
MKASGAAPEGAHGATPGAGGASSPVPAVRMTGVDKRFGAVQANRGAAISVASGEIHALVGENGAGKSTLMKVLSGMLVPDAGTIAVGGRDVTGWTTAQAIAAGVGMVHQHFMLIPTLTVAENVVLGREPASVGTFDRARALHDVDELSKQSGLIVPADRLVADLSVGEAQRVEILKTLYRGARILLLDEPTAVLSPPEVTELWGVLRRVRDAGTTIILITHKLDEVMAVTEQITVMRQGMTVARMATRETTPEGIAHAMVGREVDLAVRGARVRSEEEARDEGGEEGVRGEERGALSVQNLVVRGARVERAVNDVSFTVRAGEILGIAGVEGNGQTELLEAIAGLRRATSGEIVLGGKVVTNESVRARGDAGLSHIPEDRHQRGLVLEYSVADNLILGQQHRFSSRGAMDRHAVASNGATQIAAFDIRPTDPALAVRTLSGGNQQKVVIARELSRDFIALLAAQPTRGVDVGAIEFIHDALRKARDAGKAILLVSAELREVLSLSDRIAVMYGGRIVAMMPRAEASEEILGPYMTGARKSTAA